MKGRALGLAIALGTIFLLFVLPFLALAFLKERAYALEGPLGYATAAGIALFSSATIIIPIPTLFPAVVEIARQNGVVGVVCVFAFFSAVGESTSYLVGYLGNRIPEIKGSRAHRFLECRMQGRVKTGVAIILLAFLPMAPFDIGGIIAGNARYPYRLFFVATFLGGLLKYLYLILAWEYVERALERISWLQVNAYWAMVVFLLLVFALMEQKFLRRSFARLCAIGGE